MTSNPRPPTQTTSHGTLETSSPKKRGRPKGWKKAKDEAKSPAHEKGNPDFRLTPEMEEEAMEAFEASFKEGDVALGAITSEDMALDEELKKLQTTAFDDDGPGIEVKKEAIKRDTLRNYVPNYKPAASIMDLQEQIRLAQDNDIDSIEASPALVRHLFRKDFDYIQKTVGYGIYQNIRVYIDGFFEKNKDADKETIESKLFGKSKGDTAPIMKAQKT